MHILLEKERRCSLCDFLNIRGKMEENSACGLAENAQQYNCPPTKTFNNQLELDTVSNSADAESPLITRTEEKKELLRACLPLHSMTQYIEEDTAVRVEGGLKRKKNDSKKIYCIVCSECILRSVLRYELSLFYL